MSTRRLHIDFETRSLVDLLRCGVHKYAECPSTDLWCAAWALDDAEPSLWLPGEPQPEEIARQVRDGGIFVAHNSQFESVMWRYVVQRRYGWAPPKRENWRCTAAMAAAMSLPRSLGAVANVLGIEQQKDDNGYRLMIQMCYPRFVVHPGANDYQAYSAALTANPKHRGLTLMPDRSILVWWYSPANVQRLGAYCKQDVRTERGVENSRHMKPLSEDEQRVFVWDSLVNDRGVKVDIPLVMNARVVVRDTMTKLRDEVFVETSGYAMPTERNKIIDWLHTQGVETEKLDKEALEKMLGLPDISDVVRNVLKLRGEASMSSVGKLEAMMRSTCLDHRVRGMFLFDGAHTGRWTGKIVQLQNMMRPTGEIDIPLGLEMLSEGAETEIINLLVGPPLQVVGECMRGNLIPAGGHEYVTGDFANIEGRVNAWLAHENGKLEAFRAYDAGTGPDLYLVAAAGITGRPITDFNKKSPERQYGKVSELACLSGNTLILTKSGWITLRSLMPTDFLWDGKTWVTQRGLLDRGLRPTINIAGVETTPDHYVLAGRAWKPMNVVGSSENLMRRALARGSATLPWSAFDAAQTATTRPETSNSRPERTGKNDLSKTFNAALMRWRRVYDIAHAGPRNRFTILTDRGPLIVHNCGYQGAVHAFHNMGKNYGVHIPNKEALKIVKGWRKSNPNIVTMWKELEEAAFAAVLEPGKKVWCCHDRICFLVHGKFLWMRLPSGRMLCYCTPEIVEHTRLIERVDEDGEPVVDAVTGKQIVDKVTKPTVRFWGVHPKTKRWAPNYLYGGLLCENAVQAISRDLLVFSAFNVEAAGYPVVMHSHDELVCEVPVGFGTSVRKPDKDGGYHDPEFEKIMAKSPNWAHGLPVAIDGWRGVCYRK